MNLDLDSLLDQIADRVAQRLSSRLSVSKSKAVHPRLLTVEQAADYLGRSKSSLQHLIADRSLPTVRHDRRVFIDIQDLDNWIKGAKT